MRAVAFCTLLFRLPRSWTAPQYGYIGHLRRLRRMFELSSKASVLLFQRLLCSVDHEDAHLFQDVDGRSAVERWKPRCHPLPAPWKSSGHTVCRTQANAAREQVGPLVMPIWILLSGRATIEDADAVDLSECVLSRRFGASQGAGKRCDCWA